MPRGCVAAGCNTVYSLHGFPRDQDLHAKWIRAEQQLGRPLSTLDASFQAF